MGIPDHLTCLLRNLYAGQEATVRTGHGTDWFKIEYVSVKDVYCHPAYEFLCWVHHAKCQVGWLINWNQDCLEKYQQPQIRRWYHSNSKKWRGTKELEEDERRVWEGWLEMQHSKNKDHGICCHHSMANRWGKSGNSARFSFLGLQNHCR